MSVKDKLQIILITYNREKQLQKTFEQLYEENSPIKDYDILVLDNNSTDGTRAVVERFMQSYPNLKYQKNKYNVGLSGNIAKAMEIADKEYLWTLADDDKFDWSHWGEVENAIKNDEELIFVARYALPDESVNDPAWWILQSTFVPAYIIKTSLFTDDTIKNSFDNIYTLFPHLCPILKFINDNKKAYVVSSYVVENGLYHNLCGNDPSYVRGNIKDDLYLRTQTMSWEVGFANIISMLKDQNMRDQCLNVMINFSFDSDEDVFVRMMVARYYKKDSWFQLLDVYLQVNDGMQKKIRKEFRWKHLIIKYYFYSVMAWITWGKLRKSFRKRMCRMKVE